MKLLLTPLALFCVSALACPGDSKEAMAAAEHGTAKTAAVAKATSAKTIATGQAAAAVKPQTKATAKAASEARQTASL